MHKSAEVAYTPLSRPWMTHQDEELKHLSAIERLTVEDFVARFIEMRRQAPTEAFDQQADSPAAIRRRALRLVLAKLPLYVKEYQRHLQAGHSNDGPAPGTTNDRTR